MRDPDEFVPRRRRARSAPGPVPTLDSPNHGRWVWVNCAGIGCRHSVPMALVPLIIRWGFGTSSEKLRRCARCTKCGHKGATLTLPSAGPERGWYPFPVNRMQPSRPGVSRRGKTGTPENGDPGCEPGQRIGSTTARRD